DSVEGLGTAAGLRGGRAPQPAPPATLARGGLLMIGTAQLQPPSCDVASACGGRAQVPRGPQHFCGTGVAALPPGLRAPPPSLLPAPPATAGGARRQVKAWVWCPGFGVSVSVSLSLGVSSGWCRRPIAVSPCSRRGPTATRGQRDGEPPASKPVARSGGAPLH
ncbi:hypothetical protein N2152v2_000529, partial [Parachlorella kessleri]